MARSLSAGLQAATAKQFTNPIYLVSQDMGTTTLYSSTRELINYDGHDFLATLGLAVDSISNDQVSWSLDNSDRAVSVLGLLNDVGGNLVDVYLHYEGETLGRFTGVLDEWTIKGQRVYFVATSAAALGQRFPNARAENGTFNHLPAPGTKIMWGQQAIILEAEPL
jgi:hypothetical protein